MRQVCCCLLLYSRQIFYFLTHYNVQCDCSTVKPFLTPIRKTSNNVCLCSQIKYDSIQTTTNIIYIPGMKIMQLFDQLFSIFLITGLLSNMHVSFQTLKCLKVSIWRMFYFVTLCNKAQVTCSCTHKSSIQNVRAQDYFL